MDVPSSPKAPVDSPKLGLSRNPSVGLQESQQGVSSHVGSSPSSSSDIPTFSSPQEEQRAKRIWNFYLYGQLANVAKAAVWWSMFGTLVISGSFGLKNIRYLALSTPHWCFLPNCHTAKNIERSHVCFQLVVCFKKL